MPDANRMTVGTMAIIAEDERDAISKRTKAALAAREARGQPLGNPANLLPHHRVRGRLLGHAAIAERTANRMMDLAPVTRRIIADGRTTQPQVAAALNEHRSPASRGGRWSAAQVRRVLMRMTGA